MRDAEWRRPHFLKIKFLIMPFKSMISSIGVGLVNNALSQHNAQVQRHWTEQMWHQQNAYNHPAAMADRMRAAGLNPNNMQGAEPAGSFGSTQPAQTIPLDNPLAYAKTFAEIDNLNASTNKTGAETSKIFQDIAMLELMYAFKVIEKDEYEFKVKQLFEAYENENMYTLESNKLKADTKLAESSASLNEAQADKVESERLYTEALTNTENTLRDLRVATEKAQMSYYYAMSNSAFASASKALAEGKAVTSETERRAYILGVGNFFGIDLLSLPPAVQNSILEIYHSGENYWKSIGKSDNSAEHYNSAIVRIRQILERYMNSESAVLESDKSGYNLKFFGVGVENSTGTTRNTNK